MIDVRAFWGRVLGSPWLILFLPPLFWAGNSVAGRIMVENVPPVQFAFWRWTAALVLIAVLGAPSAIRAWPAVRRQLGSVLFLAFLGVTVYNTVLYFAVQTTTAINVALLSAAQPPITAPLAWLLLRDRIKPVQAIGVFLTLMAVVLVVGRGDWLVLAGLDLVAGDLLMLIATLIWTVYSIWLRRYPPSVPALPYMTYLIAFGVLMLLPFYIASLAIEGVHVPVGRDYLAIFYVGAFASVAAYLSWNFGVARLGPMVAALYLTFMPIFAALMAVPILGEALRWFHFAGLGLTAAGIVLHARGPSLLRKFAGARQKPWQ